MCSLEVPGSQHHLFSNSCLCHVTPVSLPAQTEGTEMGGRTRGRFLQSPRATCCLAGPPPVDPCLRKFSSPHPGLGSSSYAGWSWRACKLENLEFPATWKQFRRWQWCSLRASCTRKVFTADGTMLCENPDTETRGCTVIVR